MSYEAKIIIRRSTREALLRAIAAMTYAAELDAAGYGRTKARAQREPQRRTTTPRR